ncbi:hypothetical protein [Adhaeribacter pallidiroseus]|uniref:Uncharacterized protein n=1 Tax=Adhaeribacter pallidiroseus TaxID=2072847 RepID=A0A369QDP0_9BACT|nr:hypothetical protein [Adhaeribacter pallidiroseus]RDC62834.1 hypothetical protein AHMF7616_01428 [Adhaeribacter pallidiroseus]
MTTNYSIFPEEPNCNQALPSANAMLIVNTHQSFIQLSWKSSPQVEELTECILIISDLIKENNITFFLHDLRNVNFTDINIQRCLSKVFCLQILAAGIKRFVHLAKYELPELLILDEITTYIQTKVITHKAVRMETCTTLEGAFEWMNNSGIKSATFPTQIADKIVNVEQVSYEWAAAAQISSSLKQYKDKAAIVFRILMKRKLFYSEI